MYRMNRSGPRTDPWGTPLLTVRELEVHPSACTHCDLSVRCVKCVKKINNNNYMYNINISKLCKYYSQITCLCADCLIRLARWDGCEERNQHSLPVSTRNNRWIKQRSGHSADAIMATKQVLFRHLRHYFCYICDDKTWHFKPRCDLLLTKCVLCLSLYRLWRISSCKNDNVVNMCSPPRWWEVRSS